MSTFDEQAALVAILDFANVVDDLDLLASDDEELGARLDTFLGRDATDAEIEAVRELAESPFDILSEVKAQATPESYVAFCESYDLCHIHECDIDSCRDDLTDPTRDECPVAKSIDDAIRANL